MPDSVDASEQMVDNWTKQIQESAARYQAMAERVQGQSVTERSKDGSVLVTVNSKGLLTNLAIAEGAGGKRMAEVSGEIMKLVQLAQSRIPALLEQAMAETIGTQDQTANTMLAEASSTFPAPPPDTEPPAPQRDLRFVPEDEEPPPPRPPVPPTPPPGFPPRPQSQNPPAPRRRPARDDDDDDFGGPILS
jgi:DNA-binding protein YbaB